MDNLTIPGYFYVGEETYKKRLDFFLKADPKTQRLIMRDMPSTKKVFKYDAYIHRKAYYYLAWAYEDHKYGSEGQSYCSPSSPMYKGGAA